MTKGLLPPVDIFLTLMWAQVKGLLEKGANPQAVDKKGVSALHFGCGQGRLGVVQFLWSRGVELDSEDPGACLDPAKKFSHN